jgi:putative endonuclease
VLGLGVREEAGGWVYMLASGHYGTLYVGSTTDLVRRVYEHRESTQPGFTSKYGVQKLVWFEPHYSVTSAYQREKQIKKWKRDWKIALIEEDNPRWEDLYPSISKFGKM